MPLITTKVSTEISKEKEEILKAKTALTLLHLRDEEVLDLTDDLKSRLLVVIVEADHLKSRTVDSRAVNAEVFGQIRKIE